MSRDGVITCRSTDTWRRLCLDDAAPGLCMTMQSGSMYIIDTISHVQTQKTFECEKFFQKYAV